MRLPNPFLLLAIGLGLVTASTSKEVLVISDLNGIENTRAGAHGYNVHQVASTGFAALTVKDLQRYHAIIVSDTGSCNLGEIDWLDQAASAKLAEAVKGRVFVVGTSLTANYNAMSDTSKVTYLIGDAFDYVVTGPATGLYLSLSCYYAATSQPSQVQALSGFEEVSAYNVRECVSKVEITDPNVLPGLTGEDLSNWAFCSVPEMFTFGAGTSFTAAANGKDVSNVLDAYIFSRKPTGTSCGNSQIETAFSEQCDDGPDVNGKPWAECSSTCQCVEGETNGVCNPRTNVCGNEVVEAGNPAGAEECDAGPEGDALCTSECTCVNGLDGQGACRPVPTCGDGTLDKGEECDTGNNGDPLCSPQCTCVHGVSSTPGICNSAPVCGDGQIEGDEQCEPKRLTRLGRRGPGVVGDEVCSELCQCRYGVLDSSAKTCKPPPFCGNGVKEGAEECDVQGGDDFCTDACVCIYGVNSVTSACNSAPPTPAGCGNSVLNTGEECDTGLTSAELCSSVCKCIYGVADAATGTCKNKPQCGNGEVEKGEECEPKQLSRRASDPVVADDVCSDLCLCFYGLSANGNCNTKPGSGNNPTTTTSPPETTPPVTTKSPTSSRSPTTTGPSDTTGTSETTRASITPSGTNTVPTQTGTNTSSSASSTSTVDPFPPSIGTFDFLGCTGSDQSYPSFTLEVSSDDMDLEMCTAACSDRVYAGVHNTDCYCSDRNDAVVTVARDLCSIPCPGNPDENCGGYRSIAARLFRRQTRVPSNALLAIYVNVVLAPSGFTSLTLLPPATSTGSDPAGSSTQTEDVTVTSVATATATSTAAGCVSGYCHGSGYVFEVCQGFPAPGEVVFVLEPCACAGGWRYVEAGCDGAACGSKTVYRVEPFAGTGTSTDDVTVYQPQPCGDCAGGVTFVQPAAPAAGGDHPGGAAAGNGSTHGGDSAGSTPVLVIAGAAKLLTSYFTSVLLTVGTFAVLF